MKHNFVRKDGRGGMIVLDPKKIKRAATKVVRLLEEGATFSPEIPAEILAKINQIAGVRADQAVADQQALAAVGLVEGKVPEGCIVVHPDGPAEEHMPGFFRRPNGIHVRDGRVFADMEDSEGHGERREIVGVTPQPRRETVSRHWADGKTPEEREEILQKDEEND